MTDLAEKVKEVRKVTEQMNSDMFDAVNRAEYDISEFTALEIMQAKESFNHNGYNAYEENKMLSVKKKN